MPGVLLAEYLACTGLRATIVSAIGCRLRLCPRNSDRAAQPFFLPPCCEMQVTSSAQKRDLVVDSCTIHQDPETEVTGNSDIARALFQVDSHPKQNDVASSGQSFSPRCMRVMFQGSGKVHKATADKSQGATKRIANASSWQAAMQLARSLAWDEGLS